MHLFLLLLALADAYQCYNQPLSIIASAKSHPNVGPRPGKGLSAVAKKHDITKVHRPYQNLIEEPFFQLTYSTPPSPLAYIMNGLLLPSTPESMAFCLEESLSPYTGISRDWSLVASNKERRVRGQGEEI